MVQRALAGEPGGSLVFCGSLSMYMGLAGKGHYAAAKAGIGAMIRSMAVEFFSTSMASATSGSIPSIGRVPAIPTWS
jgi:NAD(P)-dependent dehydrogenase (short-subunit alcohol dehydrogenase family)